MENTKDWVLQNISISQDWQRPNLYCGNVTFKNGIKMQMSLTLDNSAAVKMVSILQDEITKSAQNLSDILVKSMPIQIEEKIKSETEE